MTKVVLDHSENKQWSVELLTKVDTATTGALAHFQVFQWLVQAVVCLLLLCA